MSRLNEGLYSSSDQTWMTPPDIYQPLLDFLGIEKFDLDVCCTQENIPAHRYFKEHECDSLKQDWHAVADKPICWMNPPYGDDLELFLKKAYEESRKGARIWALVPARTETKYQHEYGLTKADFTVFIYQRICFIPSPALREKLIEKHSPKIIEEWHKKYGQRDPLPGFELGPTPEWVRARAEKKVDNGTAPFPTMLLYFGSSDCYRVLEWWNVKKPILGTAMVLA